MKVWFSFRDKYGNRRIARWHGRLWLVKTGKIGSMEVWRPSIEKDGVMYPPVRFGKSSLRACKRLADFLEREYPEDALYGILEKDVPEILKQFAHGGLK